MWKTLKLFVLLGLSKKLLKIKQNKECEKLNKWLHSIKNHINWTAGSSTSVPERVAKWMPILNQDTVFPQCFHPTHTSRDKSKWFTAGVYKLSCIGSVTLLNENMKHFLFFHRNTSLLQTGESADLFWLYGQNRWRVWQKTKTDRILVRCTASAHGSPRYQPR